jgi:glutathione synthase/RimK-type ligase-like ATP-grasp enzyme
MPDVAFATYRGLPDMTDDDRLVADALRRRGVTVTPAVWDEPRTDWSRFDCVVVRSAWDYHLKPDRYAEWLRSFPAAGNRLWNPPGAILGNMNKRYLTSLAERGVHVVPTAYLPAAEGVVLHEVLNRCGWGKVVIKPAVSASACGTWRTSSATAEADQTRFAEQIQGEDVLIQPYLPEVASHGEWSLVFFDGRYSHAILKRPAAGDFRVQLEFGGISTPAEASPSLIEQAQLVLAAAGDRLLYARVDGVERAGRFLLMELEINEPYLFVGCSDGAAERFAEAIVRKLPSPRPAETRR